MRKLIPAKRAIPNGIARDGRSLSLDHDLELHFPVMKLLANHNQCPAAKKNVTFKVLAMVACNDVPTFAGKR